MSAAGRVREQAAGRVREQIAYIYGMYAYAYRARAMDCESRRFTTWASKFVMRELSASIGCLLRMPRAFPPDRGGLVEGERRGAAAPMAGGYPRHRALSRRPV